MAGLAGLARSDGRLRASRGRALADAWQPVISLAGRPSAEPGPTRKLAPQVALVLGLVLAAAAVRWPAVHLVPPYTDETEEALRAWAIARGELLPLTNVDAYVGALWAYVVAAAFKALGRQAETPRLVALAAGALTTGLTYLLARELFAARGMAAASKTGLVAAILLGGNAAHILVNSHVAWSSCAAPLFTTAAFWLLVRGAAGPGLALAGAGLLFGLALQTHPSVATLLPAALAYGLWRDHGLVVRRATWVAAALFLVGYGNMLLYNVQTGLDSLRQAQRVGSEYAEGAGLDGLAYVSSVAGFIVLFGQVVGGAAAARPTALAYLADPMVVVSTGLAVASIPLAAREGQPLPLLTVVSALALLPPLNQRWAPILEARYLMPLLPLVVAAMAGLLTRVPSPKLRRGTACRASTSFSPGLIVAVVLAGAQLAALGGYYRDEIASGRSNEGARRMIAWVAEQRRPREPFVAHRELHLLPTGGGGTWAKGLDFLLQFSGIRRDLELPEPGAHLRACDIRSVELRYVQRDSRSAVGTDPREPAYPAYWVARPSHDEPSAAEPSGTVALTAPYSLPFRPHSLFDERVPTFDTGCE
ncbi:MAG TPA: glycosyltransferase family 39 protein [Chloroflexota bacterium]|nr:glycosyltransferase family 39 protein [Chloroflexota bacterium]